MPLNNRKGSTKESPERLDLTSQSPTERIREELVRLLPEIRTEDNRIDFERLKVLLGETIDAGKERYGMSWPGKFDCLKVVQTSSSASLVPSREESVGFDTTENLIIEGDNLEVLKVLQKSYLGKVKMIYIDPPYNTGNEFIYPDNYSETLQTYLEFTGQVDNGGKKFGTNTEADGRFHSKWLSMMYPRIYLARNLLKEDGIMFVSIDDNEVRNLRALCDEIFGEENYCGTFVWEKKRKPSFLNASMGIVTEYVVAYARNRASSPPFVGGKVEQGKMYPFNNAGNPLATLVFPSGSVQFWMADGRIEPQDMSEGNIRTELLDPIDVQRGRNVEPFRLRGEWRYSQKKLDEFVAENAEIVIRRIPFRPNYVNRGDRDKKIANLLTVKGTGTPTYEDATEELRSLFGTDVIEYPKPLGVIQVLIGAVTSGTDLVLDFFAGSGTTGHAVLALNGQDDGDRRFILVQLPEPTGRADFATIAEITKERVRRAIRKLNEEGEGQLDLGAKPTQDRGFRVLKLAESNFMPWNSVPGHDTPTLERQLELHVNHVRADRTDQDILYEILLKSGYPLTVPIEAIILAGKAVQSVAGGQLLVCLERQLTLELIRAMAERKPERVVCLDEGFAGNDQLKANAAHIFEPTDRREAKSDARRFRTV
jgi:adenine-specific DNA-methyltransferase